MEFDIAYEPVVAGTTMYVGSPRNDSVTALDTNSGAEKWRFYADGPVRFAPAVWDGKVYFVCDDGCLYCLDGGSGSLVWKFRGAPLERMVLGNKRLIPVRPARGAPVIVDGIVYWAAGIWPFEGIFIYALDAESGEVVWLNDGTGATYMLQPHHSEAFAGVAPQGYFAAIRDRLLIPGGRSVPACFDRATGEFQYYHLAATDKIGAFDVSTIGNHFFNAGFMFDLESGNSLGMTHSEVVLTKDTIYGLQAGTIRAYDPKRLKVEEREDERGRKWSKLIMPELWKLDLDATTHIVAGRRLYVGGRGLVQAVEIPGRGGQPRIVWTGRIRGTARRLVAADDKLFVVTLEGRIYCFGKVRLWPRSHRMITQEPEYPSSEGPAAAREILERTGVTEGYCLAWGIGADGFLEELADESELHIIAVDPDPERVAAVRRTLDAAGLYGARIAVHVGEPVSYPFPPYIASLIVCDEPEVLRGRVNRQFVESIFYSLRPYGGAACIGSAASGNDALRKAFAEAKLDNADLKQSGDYWLLSRVGALPGSADWTHQGGDPANTVVSRDMFVKAPLGLLWFGGQSNKDILPRHGHGPSEQIVGGRLFIEGADVIRALDVYTGRVLWRVSLPDLGEAYDNTAHQPGANALGSNYVSVHDGIYVAYGDRCLRFDPATGEKLAEFRLPVEAGDDQPPDWGYVGVWEDLLIAGSGPIVFDTQVRGHTWNAVSSKRIVVMNRYTGKVLWKREAVQCFRHNAIAIGSGKVFCVDMMTPAMLDRMKRRGQTPKADSTLLALEVRTGREIWSTKENVFGTWLAYSEEHDILLQSGRPSRDMLNDEPGDRMITYKGRDGTLLWDKAVQYRGPCLLYHDTIFAQEQAFDLLTGEPRMREHPLTGVTVPWQFSRNYGCGTAIASEHLITVRSAAAGFFDLERDGGTANLGGFRSGCTSNLIAANGVLNAPDYTRTCTCSYQNQTSVALVYTPEVEMWSFNNFEAGTEPVQRVGINFGAPGDRRAEDGTLWVDYPSVGGPSPDIPLRIAPEKPNWFRHHSSRMRGDGLKWVAASGVEGVTSVTLTLAPGASTARRYTVRLHFVEPDELKPGERVFDVAIQGRPVLQSFDVAKEAGEPYRAVVKEFTGIEVVNDLTMTFATVNPAASVGAVICGVEVVQE